MPRFTPATEAALLAAGWFEGRAVPDEMMDDWLIINWLPHKNQPPRGYSKISPAAWRVLKEFGGLSIERAGSINGEPLVINPLAVVDCHLGHYAQGLEDYSWRVGAELFPIGTIDFDIDSAKLTITGIALAMSADGRFFLLTPRPMVREEDPIRFLGRSIEAALKKLVAGDKCKAVDELPMLQARDLSRRIEQRIEERERQLMSGAWPDQARIWCRNATSGFYAISDWDAEAAMITEAFGIVEPCVFDGPTHEKFLRLASKSNLANDSEPPLAGGLFLHLKYNKKGKLFEIHDRTRKPNNVAIVYFYWEDGTRAGKRSGDPTSETAALIFAKGLFKLGWLTPEIEEKLDPTLTYHEKLEWQLEMER